MKTWTISEEIPFRTFFFEQKIFDPIRRVREHFTALIEYDRSGQLWLDVLRIFNFELGLDFNLDISGLCYFFSLAKIFSVQIHDGHSPTWPMVPSEQHVFRRVKNHYSSILTTSIRIIFPINRSCIALIQPERTQY